MRATWRNRRKLHSIQLFGMPRVQKCLKLAAGEKFHEEQEHDNTVDEYAVKVVKNSETLGHLPGVLT